MTVPQRHHDNEPACRLVAGRTMSDKYLNTLRAKLPNLDALFTALAEGETPNFLDIMSAISELVAFHTNPDFNPVDPPGEIFFMSPNFCRFCP